MIANLLFTRIFIFAIRCFIRIYVMIFQNLIYVTVQSLPILIWNDTNYITRSISVIREIRSLKSLSLLRITRMTRIFILWTLRFELWTLWYVPLKTTNYANDTNYLAIRISVIREIRSHRKFQVQCSNINVSSSYHKVQNSKFKVQR